MWDSLGVGGRVYGRVYGGGQRRVLYLSGWSGSECGMPSQVRCREDPVAQSVSCRWG